MKRNIQRKQKKSMKPISIILGLFIAVFAFYIVSNTNTKVVDSSLNEALTDGTSYITYISYSKEENKIMQGKNATNAKKLPKPKKNNDDKKKKCC